MLAAKQGSHRPLALGSAPGDILTSFHRGPAPKRRLDHVPFFLASLDSFAQPCPARPNLATQRRGAKGHACSRSISKIGALLTSYTALTVSALIADINAANTAGGSNTITLTAPTTSPYVLTVVNNTISGANGLPVIAANDSLTIIGSGDTIERSTASGTPSFRLLDVAAGASLTLREHDAARRVGIGLGDLGRRRGD